MKGLLRELATHVQRELWWWLLLLLTLSAATLAAYRWFVSAAPSGPICSYSLG